MNGAIFFPFVNIHYIGRTPEVWLRMPINSQAAPRQKRAKTECQRMAQNDPQVFLGKGEPHASSKDSVLSLLLSVSELQSPK